MSIRWARAAREGKPGSVVYESEGSSPRQGRQSGARQVGQIRRRRIDLRTSASSARVGDSSPAGAEGGKRENNNTRVDERDLHRNATDAGPARSAALARRHTRISFEHPPVHTTEEAVRRRTETPSSSSSSRLGRVESALVLRSELRVRDRFGICAKSWTPTAGSPGRWRTGRARQ